MIRCVTGSEANNMISWGTKEERQEAFVATKKAMTCVVAPASLVVGDAAALLECLPGRGAHPWLVQYTGAKAPRPESWSGAWWR